MRQVTHVDGEVPFGHTLYTWLYMHNLHVEALVKHDRMETHYLAWETVRKETNPFFEVGTGFEGYFVGRKLMAADVLEEILIFSQDILDSIVRVYRYEHIFRARLMKTLVREANDAECIHLWSTYLGAQLARLRSQILSNHSARDFQNATYRQVYNLPSIVYHEEHRDITQSYVILADSIGISGRLNISLDMLSPDQQDAWLVAVNIGEFGHPLVRRFLNVA